MRISECGLRIEERRKAQGTRRKTQGKMENFFSGQWSVPKKAWNRGLGTLYLVPCTLHLNS